MSDVDTIDERLAVALVLVVDIREVVTDPADQLVVIDGVVRRWHSLETSERDHYVDKADDRFSALMRYVTGTRR